MASAVSHHPPHILDSSIGSLTPAALIPFCAYQTNMTLLGQTRQDLPFAFCSKFRPTVLEGQMCYSLELHSLKKPVSKAGLKHGLLLILDHGQVKETHFEEAEDLDQKTVSLNLEAVSAESSSAQIYINSLHSFTDYRAGGYAMSSLKQMTGTDSFLNLPAGDKKCQLETFEECQTQKYLQEVEQQCGCIPWPLDKALRQNEKVYYQGFYNILFFLRRHLTAR